MRVFAWPRTRHRNETLMLANVRRLRSGVACDHSQPFAVAESCRKNNEENVEKYELIHQYGPATVFAECKGLVWKWNKLSLFHLLFIPRASFAIRKTI